MQCIIYVRKSTAVDLYEQFNRCADYAKRHGFSVSGKVLDFDGKHFHEAINKVVADEQINALIVYSKEVSFADFDEYLFYRIYLEKLNKKLVVVE